MAQNNGGGDVSDDTITLLLLLTGASGFGLFSLSALLAPVQDWLVEVNVLAAGDSVILGWGEQNVGLDLGRLVIVSGALLLFLILVVVVVRKRMRRDV